MSISEKLKKVEDNVQTVFLAGLEVGDDFGKQAQYDEFWNSYQNSGARVYYSYAFAGEGWTNTTLRPKYKKIKPTYASYMFYESLYNEDLRDVLDIDFSECLDIDRCFLYSCITAIGVVDAREPLTMNMTFRGSALKTIEKVILDPEHSSIPLNNTFLECYDLENIEFEGRNAGRINMRDCNKLSKDSIISTIKVLSTSSSVNEELILSEEAVDRIDWTGTVIDGVTYNSFDEITELRPNWTISLV